MLKLNKINFAYGKDEVVKDISLEIAQGEILGLIGPNGAGKSTLIKLMAGLVAPQRGSVFVKGRPLCSYKNKELAVNIAVVMQENHIPFPFSAMEVVLMGRTPHLEKFGFESARDIEVAKKAMEMADVTRFASRDINELSGGERQRVFLARAIAQEAQLLFLDEPTTFLDIRHQMDVLNIMQKLNKEKGTTIIAAMHDLNFALSFCTCVALLKEGRILALGEPSEVINTETMKAAFDRNVHIGRDNKTGLPYCIPLAKSL